MYNYGSKQTERINSIVRRALVLRSPSTSQTIWPGEFVEVDLPSDAYPNSKCALEQCTDTPSAWSSSLYELWPSPSIASSVVGKIRIPNMLTDPQFLKRNENLCTTRFTPEPCTAEPQTAIHPLHKLPAAQASPSTHSSSVQLDLDNLFPSEIRDQFSALLMEYDHVFDPEH